MAQACSRDMPEMRLFAPCLTLSAGVVLANNLIKEARNVKAGYDLWRFRVHRALHHSAYGQSGMAGPGCRKAA
ncbi:hypothetical protein ROBYS_32290 [Roseobacter sp. OBYS 0001]|nr:hypothetical protein ROBYS_32290 [Roseobacter sp. OBYS 0001]